ncbi:MAG: DegV family protein [bacterium]|nr:DegV family protein [bacterium]
MESKILLSADTPCDIGPKLTERYQVSLFPLHIILEGRQYTDGLDITPNDLYDAWYTRKALPKTAAINPEEYASYFRPFVEEGYQVLHISIGSGLSSSFQNAKIAASELEGVYVVDSRNLSTGFGQLVCEAGERIKAGMPIEQIVEEVEALVPRVSASFVLDTLEFLHAGGRCSTLAHIGANLMSLKPCIQVQVPAGGSMAVGKKYAGKLPRVLKKYVQDMIGGRDDILLDRIFITDSGIDPAIEQEIRELVLSLQPFKEVHITHASCTISAHCGPNTLGILFITK